MEAWRCARLPTVMAESLFVDQERRLMNQRRVRTSRLPPLSRRGKAMPESGRVPGRIRRGLPLPSRPLREHRGSRTRARYRKKNAPLRSKTREILFKLSISVLRQLRKSFDRGLRAPPSWAGGSVGRGLGWPWSAEDERPRLGGARSAHAKVA